MSDQDRNRQASAMLARHWEHGTTLTELPPNLRPITRAEGYAIQAGLDDLTQSPLVGWKIAATSEAGQRHINVDGPLAGRLIAERLIENGATVSLANNRMRVAEAEFAFRFGQDLPPRDEPYTVDEVLAAVATLHPAIELPDSRYEDFTSVGAPQLIADNACAHQFMPGPAVLDEWRSVDLVTFPVLVVKNGTERFEGAGANVLGDPRLALTWLVNELSRLGITLHAGEMVTTGTCLTPVPIAPGDEIHASWGSFGELTLRLT